MDVQRYISTVGGGVEVHPHGSLVLMQDYLKLKVAYDKLKEQVEQEGALKLIENPDQRYIIRYVKNGEFHYSNICTKQFAKDKLENIINNLHGTNVELLAISDCQYTTSPATVTITSIRKV